MKLYIHSGLHKTATTSFQAFCSINRSELIDVGLYYPKWKRSDQHSWILHEYQKEGIAIIENYFDSIHREATINKSNSVLLSGEDFENCIVDIGLAKKIESAADKAGFDSVTWIVVTRDQDELIKSLYAELSKQSVLINLDIINKSTAERGCFYVSSELYNYIFVTDFFRFEDEFNQNISGNCICIKYSDFIESFAGKTLLEHILTESQFLELMKLVKIDRNPLNKKMSSINIQTHYLFTGLDIGKPSRISKLIMLPLILFRVLVQKIRHNS